MSPSRAIRFFVLASSLTVAPSALAHGIDEGTYVLGDNVPHLRVARGADSSGVVSADLVGRQVVRHDLDIGSGTRAFRRFRDASCRVMTGRWRTLGLAVLPNEDA